MRTLNIAVSENEFIQLGVSSENLTLTEFRDIISKELMTENLDRCIELSEKLGLSNMSMEEITAEVMEVRRYAKNRN